MKQIVFPKLQRQHYVFLLLCFFMMLCNVSVAQTSGTNKTNDQSRVISYVDHSLKGSQKYVLRVGGKPFYMTNIQIRLDKLRYWWGWDVAAREAIVAQAARDGFNTIVIPILWYEVEPEKNQFNWNILDEYLGLANKYNLKVEMLWFGSNSGGHVQWLGSNANPVHLRTPDYVLYSPGPRSAKTVSEYTIKRKMTDYTLDMADNKLRERETYVLSHVMDHIASWDAANGSKHTVIGVQIDNEVRGKNGEPFPGSLVLSYLSDVASAIKKSKYVVWTRVNTVYTETLSRIIENEALRSGPGTNIDFVGIDTYRHHFDTDEAFTSSMQTNVPYIGKNYRMIMEVAAEYPSAGQLRLAALAGNNNLTFYDMIGPDGHGLYKRSGKTGFTPQGEFVEDIRAVNKILNSDLTDVALNASGYGLFVHNWNGTSAAPTIGVEGISFAPDYPTSQGISISRSNTEIVLMSSKGGSFTFPDSLYVKEASKGHFDNNNKWISESSVYTKDYSGFGGDGYEGASVNGSRNNSIFVEAGTTVYVTTNPVSYRYPRIIKQAEFAKLGGGTTVESLHIGFAGNGYLKFPLSGGYVTWTDLDGLQGGEHKIRLRYANGDTKTVNASVFINGVHKNVHLPPTDSWETYKLVEFDATLVRGKTNTILLESTWYGAGHIDELQIL